MRSTRWLTFLLAFSMVMGQVPVPALAEVMDEFVESQTVLEWSVDGEDLSEEDQLDAAPYGETNDEHLDATPVDQESSEREDDVAPTSQEEEVLTEASDPASTTAWADLNEALNDASVDTVTLTTDVLI